MSKTIAEILAPKPEARPRIYAYSIDDKAHKRAPIEARTGGVSSQPRRGVIFVETPHTNTKLRRSDIGLLMPPRRGFGEYARRSTKMALLRSSPKVAEQRETEMNEN